MKVCTLTLIQLHIILSWKHTTSPFLPMHISRTLVWWLWTVEEVWVCGVLRALPIFTPVLTWIISAESSRDCQIATIQTLLSEHLRRGFHLFQTAWTLSCVMVWPSAPLGKPVKKTTLNCWSPDSGCWICCDHRAVDQQLFLAQITEGFREFDNPV